MKFTFPLIHEYHFNDHFVHFYHFWLPYHILILFSTCVNIRADSKQISSQSALFSDEYPLFQSWENQRWTALIQSWFSLKHRWIFQFWTALIQRKSKLISANVLCVLWISAEKRQLSETALFSADCLGLQPGVGFTEMNPMKLYWVSTLRE